MSQTEVKPTCYHCGEDCSEEVIHHDNHEFCCHGCKTVYTLLQETGLTSYYEIEDTPGSTVKDKRDNRDFLDLEEVKTRFIDFAEGNQNKVAFYLPSVHCAACIWLLEKLDKLNNGIIKSEVNFLRKELTVLFDSERISLKEVVLLLEDLGYPPDLQRDQNQSRKNPEQRKILLKLGVAGFCFGNIMLFSFPEYLSLDEASLESFKPIFGYLNFLLAFPVLLYSSIDYLRSAWKSLKVRYLTIDVPIALGILTLFGRSAYEIVTQTGAGYFDSFAGLLFFLLVGKWYQSRTYEALAFDRDFKSYFPIAVSRIKNGVEEVCMLEKIEVGDRLKILNGQVIPADSVLIKGLAAVDYSFVNGESDLVEKREGDYLYAGGRQTAGAIEVEVIKEVSQGYLTSLWNQDTFAKEDHKPRFSTMIDRVSKFFSIGILLIAFATLAFWLAVDPAEAIDAFTAVLIIACPCALALSMPFASGNVSRILGKLGFFVKNAATLEKLAHIKTVVFDKTGTLTKSNSTKVQFVGDVLSQDDLKAIKGMVSNSTHPLSVAIRNQISLPGNAVTAFEEIAGKGIRGVSAGREFALGSAQLAEGSAKTPETAYNQSVVHLWIDGAYKGHYTIEKEIRKGIPELVKSLQAKSETHLLSGDNESERKRMEQLFGTQSQLLFNQSPTDKLKHIESVQKAGKSVLMLGDGLNDAGALKQADVGIAVADDVFSFSPACDAILQADRLQHLAGMMKYIRQSMTTVRISIVISLLYNLVGLYFAVQSELTPIFAAILMPLSSVTVIGFVSMVTTLIRPKV